MTTKHTPGPWQVVKNGHETYIGDINQNAIQLMNEANANIMASAPELLEALKIAEKRIIDLTEMNYASKEASSETLGIIKQAIAKAEGKS